MHEYRKEKQSAGKEATPEELPIRNDVLDLDHMAASSTNSLPCRLPDFWCHHSHVSAISGEAAYRLDLDEGLAGQVLGVACQKRGPSTALKGGPFRGRSSRRNRDQHGEVAVFVTACTPANTATCSVFSKV